MSGIETAKSLMTTNQVSWFRDGTIGRFRWLRGWRGLALLATIAFAIGLGASWHWLASVGASSLLLTALPCLVMCALGLCMHRMGGAFDRRNALRKTPGASFRAGKSYCGEPAGTTAKQRARVATCRPRRSLMSLRHAAPSPRAKWLTAAIVFASMLAASAPASAHSLLDLERELTEREAYVEFVDRAAPDFALEDASRRPVGLQDLRGKVVVLWFIYTSCPDVCPVQSEAIAAIQKMVNQTPMRDLVTFVSITTDPARDTPQVLKDYGPSHGLDPVNWLFLTSGLNRPDATRELAERFGLKFTLTPDGEQMHGVVTYLIDKSGHLKARYHGLKFDRTNVLLYINALTNDYH